MKKPQKNRKMTSFMCLNVMMTFVWLDLLYDFKGHSDLYGWFDIIYYQKRSQGN